MKKYEFTGEIKQIFGLTLHRIRRLSDGLTGGWIENEKNLSHEGTCFVYGSAQVYGEARVFESAQVYGSAWVYGEARVFGSAWVAKSPINIIGLSFPVTITETHMFIGCKGQTHAEWVALTELEAEKMGVGGRDFFRWHRHTLLSLIAYHTRE